MFQFLMTTMVGLDVTHRVLMGATDRPSHASSRRPSCHPRRRPSRLAVARADEIAGRNGAPIHDATP